MEVEVGEHRTISIVCGISALSDESAMEFDGTYKTSWRGRIIIKKPKVNLLGTEITKAWKEVILMSNTKRTGQTALYSV